MVVTSSHLWTLELTSNKYEDHRQLDLTKVEAITESEEPDSFEVVLHVKDDVDERYNCVIREHKQNLLNTVEAILSLREVTYKFFRVADAKLRKFTTQKADVDKKKFKRPDEEFQLKDHQAPESSFQFALVEDAQSEPKDKDGEALGSQKLEAVEAKESEDEDTLIAKK